MASDGVDVSGLQAITGMYNNKPDLAARGLTKSAKWDDRDPTDNKIVVPYSFHKNYPDDYKAAAIAAYERMNSDLGCIKLKYVDKNLSQYMHGIFIIFEDVSGTGCYSALGRSPGFIGSSGVESISELGAPGWPGWPGWQVMAFGTMPVSSCNGLDEGTIMHEMLHALGVQHEHSRPDRDNYLNVNLDATTEDSEFTKITNANWLQVFDSKNNDMYPYEPDSVMHYGSYDTSTDHSIPVMTYKDGSTFGDKLRMTTTDSLQVIWAYCNADSEGFSTYKTEVLTQGQYNIV